jgi:hypothetical protein
MRGGNGILQWKPDSFTASTMGRRPAFASYGVASGVPYSWISGGVPDETSWKDGREWYRFFGFQIRDRAQKGRPFPPRFFGHTFFGQCQKGVLSWQLIRPIVRLIEPVTPGLLQTSLPATRIVSQ